MTDSIHIFVYDPPAARGVAHERVRDDSVQGTLFDVDGVGPALMLSGQTRVRGEVHRVAPETLTELDARARVREGLYRRVGVRVGDTACWTWVAGPSLAPRLMSARRSRSHGGESA